MNKRIKILLSVMMVSLSALIICCSQSFTKEEKVLSDTSNELEILETVKIQESVYKNRNYHKETFLKPEKTQNKQSGWIVGDCVNVRNKPSVSSNIVGKLYFNEKITFCFVNEKWVSLLNNSNIVGYVNKEYVSEKEISYKTFNAPYTDGNKSYMPYMIHKNGKYKSIFSSSSIA